MPKLYTNRGIKRFGYVNCVYSAGILIDLKISKVKYVVCGTVNCYRSAILQAKLLFITLAMLFVLNTRYVGNALEKIVKFVGLNSEQGVSFAF